MFPALVAPLLRLGQPARSEATIETPPCARIDVTLDGDRTVDRRLVLAVSCLDVLRVRPVD